MKLIPKSAYPKVSRNAISIDPDNEASLNVDKAIFNLYEESKKKNGELVTYNQLELFITNTGQWRQRILDVLIEDEKWFKRGIEAIKKHKRPYLEKQDQDTNKVEYLWEAYPNMHFENFIENYVSKSVYMLSDMIHYLDINMDYFNQVTVGNVAKGANSLRIRVLEFNEIHLLHERSKDLAELLSSKLVTHDLKKEEFVRTVEDIRKESKKLGRKFDPGAPQHSIEKLVITLLNKALDKELGFEKFIHSEGRYKGTANKNQIMKYINKEEPEIRGELSDRAFLIRIKKATSKYMK